MKKKGVAIYWLIFWGVIIGIAIGIIAVEMDATQFIKHWITPLGDIFVKILGLIAVPLLFVSLVKGIINLESTAKLVSLGWHTILVYTTTTIIATIFALGVVLVVKPGNVVSGDTSKNFFGEFSAQTDNTLSSASDFAAQSPLNTFVEMIPSNVITPFSGGASIIQALVLAIFVAATIVTIKGNRLESIRNLISDADALLTRSIDMAMYIAPVGIMALMANVVVDSNGEGEILKALGLYTATTVGSIIIFALVFYPLMIALFTKIKARDYLVAVLPVQLMAISTSSSAATLPTTMKVANNTLKIPKSVSSFTLPMGVTINMDGSSIFLTITVIFIAQVMNIDLTMAQIMTIVLTSIIASIGTPGIPGGVLVTVVMVLDSIGIPVESIALVIALVRPIDMFVTALNVTGDVAVSAVVAANQGAEEEEQQQDQFAHEA